MCNFNFKFAFCFALLVSLNLELHPLTRSAYNAVCCPRTRLLCCLTCDMCDRDQIIKKGNAESSTEFSPSLNLPPAGP